MATQPKAVDHPVPNLHQNDLILKRLDMRFLIYGKNRKQTKRKNKQTKKPTLNLYPILPGQRNKTEITKGHRSWVPGISRNHGKSWGLSPP